MSRLRWMKGAKRSLASRVCWCYCIVKPVIPVLYGQGFGGYVFLNAGTFWVIFYDFLVGEAFSGIAFSFRWVRAVAMMS